MLDTETKRRIDTARDILVGKVPDTKLQALIAINVRDFISLEDFNCIK
jgi:hypothetical protein